MHCSRCSVGVNMSVMPQADPKKMGPFNNGEVIVLDDTAYEVIGTERLLYSKTTSTLTASSTDNEQTLPDLDPQNGWIYHIERIGTADDCSFTVKYPENSQDRMAPQGASVELDEDIAPKVTTDGAILPFVLDIFMIQPYSMKLLIDEDSGSNSTKTIWFMGWQYRVRSVSMDKIDKSKIVRRVNTLPNRE